MFKKLLLSLALIAIALFHPLINTPVFADELELAQLAETSFFGDVPLVLTATRLKHPKGESPIATSIIDRDMIEASGFTEIPDLLRLAPGMLVNYDSGHIPAAGYQFLFNRYTVRMQILVDGRSVYTPIFGEMPWTQLGITVDDIERIEVIRGPSASSYGPNAMTGVISIITRDAVDDQGISLKTHQGSFGRNENFLRMVDSTGDLDYRITLASREDDGFRDRHDGKEVSIANFRGDYQLSTRDVITLHATFNDGDLQEDNVFDTGLHPDHIKQVTQSSQQIIWKRTLDTNNDISINYYHQHYKDDNAYTSTNPFTGDPLLMDESVHTDRHNLEFTHSIYDDDYNLGWGIILRRDRVKAPQYLYQPAEDSSDTTQAFINSQLFINRDNIVNLSLLADHNDTAENSYSPRVSYIHHLETNHSLRLSWARASRNPFIFEEYTDYTVPDVAQIWSDLSDLDGEEIESWDLGYLGLFNHRKTEIDLRLFQTELRKLIILDSSLGTGGFLQGDAFDITGIESSVSHQHEDSRLVLNLAVINIDARQVILGDDIWYESGAPQKSMSVLLMHDFPANTSASLGYYYTGLYQQLCCEASMQAPRKRLDLVVSRNFRMSGYNAELKLVLQNITDDEVETRLLNNYERQGYVSLGVKFL